MLSTERESWAWEALIPSSPVATTEPAQGLFLFDWNCDIFCKKPFYIDQEVQCCWLRLKSVPGKSEQDTVGGIVYHLCRTNARGPGVEGRPAGRGSSDDMLEGHLQKENLCWRNVRDGPETSSREQGISDRVVKRTANLRVGIKHGLYHP